MIRIAELATNLNIFEYSIKLYCKALDFSENMYSKDGINNFTIINALAAVREDKRENGETASLYSRSLARSLKKIFGTGHINSLMTFQGLENISIKLSNIATERLVLEKAYIGYENLVEPDPRMALSTLNNLAVMEL